jgi:pilus assembly protein Flp/PilA
MMLISFVKDETGLELSEYAVAAALIALAVVGVFTVLGDAITTKINELGSHIALGN